MTVQNRNGKHRPEGAPASAPPETAKALLERGMGLYTGSAGRLDPRAAAEAFARAAETGDPSAILWAARLHWKGLLGFKRDQALAKALASEEVLAETERRTEKGDLQAAFALASALFDGLAGLDGRVLRAIGVYRQAAEAGHAASAYNLGYILAKGLGVKSNPAEAVALYRKAAALGHAKAMFKLGRASNGGYGMAKDRGAALGWFREAASRGHAGAMFRLGLAFARGSGVPKDEAKAVEWYREAARAGLEDAAIVLRKRGLAEE